MKESIKSNLIIIIEGFLEEEDSAGEEYVELANALKYFGYISESEKVFGMAVDEGKHRKVLKQILEKLKR